MTSCIRMDVHMHVVHAQAKIFKTVGVAAVTNDFVQRGCYSQQQLKAPQSHFNFCLHSTCRYVNIFLDSPQLLHLE